MVASGCTVAACWHVTLALLVVVASVRHVNPYRHCSNVKHVHLGNLCARAPWEHTSLKCTAEPAVTSFIFEARGSTGALSSREAGSGAPGYMVVPKPSSVGRRGPEPWYTWQHVIAHPTLCLGLMPVCEGTQSVGYRQEPTQWWQQ
jgi:hypothetical protein